MGHITQSSLMPDNFTSNRGTQRKWNPIDKEHVFIETFFK